MVEEKLKQHAEQMRTLHNRVNEMVRDPTYLRFAEEELQQFLHQDYPQKVQSFLGYTNIASALMKTKVCEVNSHCEALMISVRLKPLHTNCLLSVAVFLRLRRHHRRRGLW